MSGSDNAAVNRSLRTIHTELDYLVELGLVTGQVASKIAGLLPSPPPIQFASAGAASVRSPTVDFIKPEPVSAPYQEPRKQDIVPIREKVHTPVAEPTPPPPPPAYALPADAFRAKALWAYHEKNPGDLNFDAGQHILVLKKENEEWWSGRVIDPVTNEPTGAAGIFPCAYVEAVKADKGYVSGDMGTGYINQSFGGGSSGGESKAESQGKKFGKKLGNAAIFGAGATLGGKIVNGIF